MRFFTLTGLYIKYIPDRKAMEISYRRIHPKKVRNPSNIKL